MDGILIDDLEILTNIEDDQVFLISLSGNSYVVRGNTFITAFSSVKDAESFGYGIPVFNQAINLVDGRFGTSLKFNSVSAGDGLYSILDQNTIKIGLSSGLISGEKFIDGSISPTKLTPNSIINSNLSSNCISTELIQNNSITTEKIQDGAISLNKMATSLYDLKTNTSIQIINANTGTYVDTLSVTVTPPTVNSTVLITGHLTLGLKCAGVNLIRTINGLSVPVSIADSFSNVSSFTFVFPRNASESSPTTGSLNFLDVPNTTDPVTYSVYVESTSSFDTYINRSYDELDEYSSSRGTSQIAALVLP